MNKLIDRVAWAKEALEKVQPDYAIVWEDPETPEEPVHVTVPSPEWMAMARYGGLLPPVEVYHEIEDTLTADGKVTKGHLLHDTDPVGPMTQEEAIEYILMKDVPRRVWQQSHNRQMFYIVPRSAVPTNRTFRNAWRLNNG